MLELAKSRVMIAGAGGAVGSALMRLLHGQTRTLRGWRQADGDLREETAARAALIEQKYDVVFLLAATQGGIADNIARPRAFLEDNARIAFNVIGAAAECDVSRLVFAGSTVLYSPDAPQPYREQDLAKGALDATHEGYALAKLLGMRLCAYYASERGLHYTTAVLGNVIGPGCTFEPPRAGVAASLIKRAVDARRAGASALSVWGTGRATRDLLPAADAAAALALIAERQASPAPINVASGVDRPMVDIAKAAAAAAGFEGAIAFDASKPEGALSRSVDIAQLRALGFSPQVQLADAFAELAAIYESS
ncbi:MAG: NAD-dependent epimerase/dehydratase family protein [Hyphomonadaceae bacterium]